MSRLSPPISLAIAPHSGSHAKTLSAACAAVRGAAASRAMSRTSRVDAMAGSSIAVGAMGADADDVLQNGLVIRLGPRFVERVLQAKPAELARRVVDHCALAMRRRAAGVERRAGESAAGIGGGNLVIAQPEAPSRDELIGALDVPAGLVIAAQTEPVQHAGLVAVEILTLQLEIPLDRVAVGRPFVDGVEDREVVPPVEEIGSIGAVARLGMQPGQPGAERAAVADVVADVD